MEIWARTTLLPETMWEATTNLARCSSAPGSTVSFTEKKSNKPQTFQYQETGTLGKLLAWSPRSVIGRKVQQCIHTSHTVVIDHGNLGQDDIAPRDHTTGTDQLAAHILHKRKLADSNMNVLGNPLIVGEHVEDDALGSRVDLQNLSWSLRRELNPVEGLNVQTRTGPIPSDLKIQS